jgi:hypothetical protein
LLLLSFSEREAEKAKSKKFFRPRRMRVTLSFAKERARVSSLNKLEGSELKWDNRPPSKAIK